jgi:hypothetical protein
MVTISNSTDLVIFTTLLIDFFVIIMSAMLDSGYWATVTWYWLRKDVAHQLTDRFISPLSIQPPPCNSAIMSPQKLTTTSRISASGVATYILSNYLHWEVRRYTCLITNIPWISQSCFPRYREESIRARTVMTDFIRGIDSNHRYLTFFLSFAR